MNCAIMPQDAPVCPTVDPHYEMSGYTAHSSHNTSCACFHVQTDGVGGGGVGGGGGGGGDDDSSMYVV